MSSRGQSKSKTRRMAPRMLLHQARERQRELEGARPSISIPSVPPSTSFCSDDREMDHITPKSSYWVDFASSRAAPQPEEHDSPASTHSITSVHSMFGEDAYASISAVRPLHLRNYRPNRAGKRAEKHATRAEDAGLPRVCKKTRGKNKAHRLASSFETDEPAFPLHFDEEFCIIGSNAERFGQYIRQESRQFTDFPLHLNWCAHHERSCENFFLQAQKDYEFLPQDPYCPLKLLVIYRGIKTKMQERVRGNRNQVKMECYELWLKTPEEKRRALFQEKAEEKRNKVNRESKKRGRATYTGGSRSIVRAKQKVRAQIEESGGSSSALKEYFDTHATLVDPNGDTYSCIYPDTQTQEYCPSLILPGRIILASNGFFYKL
ncbi:uncharacterized protein A4U43_C09F8870 [Asparagus officinalis]|uniref:Uncharacterized protein n=1 Tax=Asparagus officinalis TaxID=4686 RepID=A0A5P1E6A0_ASPOF|nr:uncharacterized protein A4U43_C09F8870 [Asparagus officinalis]